MSATFLGGGRPSTTPSISRTNHPQGIPADMEDPDWLALYSAYAGTQPPCRYRPQQRKVQFDMSKAPKILNEINKDTDPMGEAAATRPMNPIHRRLSRAWGG